MSNPEELANRPPDQDEFTAASAEIHRKAKFEVYGEEMIEKPVKPSGKSGRIYLPQEGVGKNVKIIRTQ